VPDNLLYRSLQGPHVDLLDQFFGGTPEQLRTAYADALQRVQDEATLGDLVARDAGGKDVPGPMSQLDAGDVEHFKNDWLSRPEVAPVMRQAYRHAIELASNRDIPIPIETFWIVGGEDFEYYISENERQVTVLASIPSDGTVVAGTGRASKRAWIIRAESTPRDDDAVVDQVAGGPAVVRRQVGGPAT